MLLPNPSRHIRDNQRAVENLALGLARRKLAVDAKWPGVSDAVLTYVKFGRRDGSVAVMVALM
jgi:hypothetical protein